MASSGAGRRRARPPGRSGNVPVRSLRQRDVPVVGALAAGERARAALALDVGAWQGEGCLAPAAHAVDGGAGALVGPGGGGRAAARALLHTADGGETVGGVRTQAREGVPGALADVWRAAAHTPGAEAQGSGGEAIAVFAVQDGALQRLCREAVGGGVGDLRAQTACTDRGCLGPFALATEVESRTPVGTQGGHARAPC